MERKTFILLMKKTFRHTVKLYLKEAEGSKLVDQRNVKFTTEHKVSEKQRAKRARGINAEFSTSDEIVYDAMLRDTGYGKTFILKGDEELKLKREPFNITPLDARKIALKNLFDAAELSFNPLKDTEVLTEEYKIHSLTLTGKNITESAPMNAVHSEKDVLADIEHTAASARKVYQEKYNEPVPSEFANDLAFLSALANPEWDAKTYIKEHSTKKVKKVDADEEEDGNDIPDNAEDLGKLYFSKFSKNVCNAKKNDIAWIKKQLTEG